jgi:hypothetical protein
MSLAISQRSDYTFKGNVSLGRHGWLRLTPAHSVKLVDKILSSSSLKATILDPFSGTATTALLAAQLGHRAYSFDINPFLVWFGNAKAQNYTEDELWDIQKKVGQVLKEYKSQLQEDHWTPPIFNIERWWSGSTLRILASLRTSLAQQFGEPEQNHTYSLVWISFCRLVIETSSAAFNHVSMSFHESVMDYNAQDIEKLFLIILDFVLQSAQKYIPGHAKVLRVDSRHIVNSGHLTIDKVITSPPYPNRMSYIRELRPYMYWTKFLQGAKQAGELDWLAIGGTWGIATSRLKTWTMEPTDLPEAVLEVVQRIQMSEGKNSNILAIYVLKYFQDMYSHLSSLRSVLKPGAEVHYIVGNSIFFNQRVDTAALLADLMKILGYGEMTIEMVRKRNCNKALYEYCLSARWREDS